MSDVHPHDLHRHDDDGGHMHHPVRLARSEKRLMREVVNYCEALIRGEEVWETAPLVSAYRRWRDA